MNSYYVPHKVMSAMQRARRIPQFEAFLRSRYEREFATARDANLFRGIFGSAAEAAASAPAGGVVGYDHPDPASLYRERLDQIYPTDYPVLYWLTNLLGDLRTVFDLGGHVGVARYAYVRYLDFPQGLRWKVCDVQAVVEAGENLARERGMSGLTFTTDRNDASAVDLYHAAGVLQYLEEPLPEMLAALAEKPRHVLINLCAFTDRDPFVTLQNIGTAFCPYIIHRKADVFAGMGKLGYRLVDEWTNPGKSCVLPLDAERSLPHYVGAYFTRGN